MFLQILRRLINEWLQNLSTLIGQLHVSCSCDWLTKVKQIYEPSCLLFHGIIILTFSESLDLLLTKPYISCKEVVTGLIAPGQ